MGCGSTSGKDGLDKFARFGLDREQATHIKAPLVAQAVAVAECKVEQTVDLGASALIVAKILRAAAAPEAFEGSSWKLGDGLELIHHLGGNKFAVSDRVITAKMPAE